MLIVCYLCTKTHVSGIPICTSRLPNDGEALDDHSKMLLRGGQFEKQIFDGDDEICISS
jgi:hypothetical protein